MLLTVNRPVEDKGFEVQREPGGNSMLLTTDAVGKLDAGSLHRSNPGPERATGNW
jgi:hypothetical protein